MPILANPVFWVAAILALGLVVWFLYVENNTLEVTYYQVPLKTLPKDFDGLRIALISDLHGSIFGQEQSDIASAIEDFKPDMIAIAGDLIDRRSFTCEAAEKLLKSIKNQSPIFYVTGNHEISVDNFGAFEDLLSKYGVTLLRNQVQIIEKGNSKIAVAGLDDPLTFSPDSQEQRKGCQRSLSQIAERIGPNTFSILLAHRPHLLEIYASYDIDLVLSGHAHGGMIKIPRVGGLVSPGQGFLPKYTEGIYRYDETAMVVSRGLGNSGPFQLRLFNKPELVLLTLKSM